jgi:hypothetical protein
MGTFLIIIEMPVLATYEEKFKIAGQMVGIGLVVIFRH